MNEKMDMRLKRYLASMLLEKGVGSKAVEKFYANLIATWGEDIPEEIFRELGMKVSRELLDDLEKNDVKMIAMWEKDYPQQLLNLHYPPVILFCRGNTDLLETAIYSIVGTRRITSYGKNLVRDVLKVNYPMVSKQVGGFAYLSGLAYGVDGEVHKLALEVGVPTIAVVAGGVDRGYPTRNRGLYQDIAKKGLVVGEFPPGREVVKGMFPMRNRIIAGLARGVVVVESPAKGGSMITAKWAMEKGVNVYTFPGSVFRKTSEGCNQLIAQGVMPLLNRGDWLEVLGFQREGILKDESCWLREFLEGNDKEVFTLDELIDFAAGSESLNVDEIYSELTKYELEGILKRQNSNFTVNFNKEI
ncbi:DNA-protecting protein DprA [Candidatus Dojkabacteria bacterium]|nr:DNA-protecting protein DprA [Candidatus Dojkabacteria bacterium]